MGCGVTPGELHTCDQAVLEGGLKMAGNESTSQQQGGHHRALMMAALGLVASFHPRQMESDSLHSWCSPRETGTSAPDAVAALCCGMHRCATW